MSRLVAAPTGGGQVKHFGPYASDSPDSGTCGNDWAQDTFDRHFTVKPNGDGTNSVVEQFKDGSFTTVAGPSPGGCDTTYTNHGTTVDAGKSGSMHGYEIISNVGAQTNDSPFCDGVGSNANCTTATFIATHFAPSAYTVTTFFFHYTAGAQGLLYHEWKNASDDRGGNGGDIATG